MQQALPLWHAKCARVGNVNAYVARHYVFIIFFGLIVCEPCFPALQAASTASGIEANRLGTPLQVVRSVLWLDSAVLVSGGEDARLVQWHAQPAAAAEPQHLVHKSIQRASSAASRKDHLARNRHSPY